MDRVEELEQILNCTIHEPITAGQSLEKYHATLDDQEVLLRIFSDDGYYSNRFLREGLVLRNLDTGSMSLVRAPRLIDEWPEYQIRAIEWVDMQDHLPSDRELEQISTWLVNNHIVMPFDLSQDLVPHLLDTSDINPGYKEFYTQALDTVLDEIDWGAGRQGLLHGDLHPGNIGRLDDTLILYDWEYTTQGSHWYDLAYYHLHTHSDGEKLPADIPQPWYVLVGLVNCHWYLQESQFSPKEAIHWVDIVGQLQ